MEVLRYGENGLRILFGSTIDVRTNEQIRKAHSYLKSLSLPGVVDIVPSFLSCLIIFDPETVSFSDLASFVEAGGSEIAGMEIAPSVIHEIPVLYGGEYGPDLGFVASYCGLSEEQVVEVHISRQYTVFSVGFLPGFPYLGPLDPRLFVPRLETPRVKVPEGSVAIAQLQTGIYSFESPGGWRIIGRTAVRLFDPENEPYSMLKTGDLVRFARA